MMNKNLIVIILSLWCAIEFIIFPYPYYAKLNNIFPTINIGGLHFDLSEVLIYSFIGFGLFLMYVKLLKTKSLKISLGYGYHKYLVLSFITVLIASIFIGYINRGSEFMVMIRVQIVFLLFLIFMNIYDIKKIILFIIKIIYWVGIVTVLIFLLSLAGLPLWKITIYPDKFIYIGNAWYGLYISIFSYAILLNKIIIRKATILDYIFILLIILAVIINISAKPIVLGMFIVTFTTFLFYFKNNIKRVKIGIISILMLLSPIFMYQAMNDEQKTLFIYTLSIRFLKLPAYNWNDVINNFSHLQASGGKDISAGRFELWTSYLKDAINTPIVSSHYGHKHWTELSALSGLKVPFQAHNSIVHYTYYSGYIAGISLLLIILYFIRGTFKYKNRLIYYNIAKNYNIKEYEFYGILAYIYAIMGDEMVGRVLQNAKFSWFWWLLVVFVLKVISESRMEKYNVRND